MASPRPLVAPVTTATRCTGALMLLCDQRADLLVQFLDCRHVAVPDELAAQVGQAALVSGGAGCGDVRYRLLDQRAGLFDVAEFEQAIGPPDQVGRAVAAALVGLQRQ